MIGPVIPSGHAAIVRAHRLTGAAGAALARVTPTADLFASVGETLMWLVALEDLLVSADGQYWAKRSGDADGAVLPGIRYARNAVVHGETVVTTINVSGGAMLGAAMLPFMLGAGPSTTWSARASIGFTPDPHPYVAGQEQSYDGEVAGQDVHAPLERALAFLRDAAGT